MNKSARLIIGAILGQKEAVPQSSLFGWKITIPEYSS